MKLAMIGTGYVGLVTGVCFAEYGNTVICADNDKAKIDALNEGRIPIYEPGLSEMTAHNKAIGSLEFTDDIAYALSSADICFICVGTPQADDGRTDLSYVLGVAAEIGENMTHDMIIVDKSTVPVGTADKVRAEIQAGLDARGADFGFSMVSNPEFLKEGDAVSDCMHPDRIVVGTDDHETGKTMRALYAPFTRRSERYIEMDVRSAEMTKYAANAMLATKISFINEIANICEMVGADVNKVRVGIGSDSRIGYSFIYPGIGYGGSCFPKDVNSIIWEAENNGYHAEVLKAVDNVNSRQKIVLLQKIYDRFGGSVQGMKFAVWGLAFKPNTDDMREAPSVSIIGGLIRGGASVKAYDPEAMPVAARSYFAGKEGIEYGNDKYGVLDGADALLLLTEWKEFLNPDLDRVKGLMNRMIIFDGRNQYDAEQIGRFGFEYHQIGVGVDASSDDRILRG
jgi:UDPglucose 6-dehydrogenase